MKLAATNRVRCADGLHGLCGLVQPTRPRKARPGLDFNLLPQARRRSLAPNGKRVHHNQVQFGGEFAAREPIRDRFRALASGDRHNACYAVQGVYDFANGFKSHFSHDRVRIIRTLRNFNVRNRGVEYGATIRQFYCLFALRKKIDSAIFFAVADGPAIPMKKPKNVLTERWEVGRRLIVLRYLLQCGGHGGITAFCKKIGFTSPKRWGEFESGKRVFSNENFKRLKSFVPGLPMEWVLYGENDFLSVRLLRELEEAAAQAKLGGFK